VINKIDRLILELKLPPQDAYYKLTHTIQEVNGIIAHSAASSPEPFQPKRISPELNNVIFASAEHGWSFSLMSFATLYASRHPSGGGIDPRAMSRRLWGDWFFDDDSKCFSKNKPHPSSQKTFVQFILEPVYKIYSQVHSFHHSLSGLFLFTLS
jgi:116 kDa U5 small nuclear ribonucleoprotein component